MSFAQAEAVRFVASLSLALVLVDCRRQPPPSLNFTLVEQADVWRANEGAPLIDCYSPSALPTLRIPTSTTGLTISIVQSESSIETRIFRTGHERNFRVEPQFQPRVGRAQLVVSQHGIETDSATIYWLPSDRQILARHKETSVSEQAWERVSSSSCPYDAFRASVQLGKLAYATSNTTSALEYYAKAAERALGLGFVGEVSARSFSRSFLHLQQREVGAARSIAQQARTLDLSIANKPGLARQAYILGGIARQSGETMRAIRELRTALDLSQDFGPEAIYSLAGAYLGLALSEVGRFEEAVEVLDKFAPTSSAPNYVRSPYFSNRASLLWQAHRAKAWHVDLAMVAGLFRRALSVGAGVVSNQENSNLRARLAAVEMERGNLAAATRILHNLTQSSDEELGSVRWLAPLLSARLALLEGDFPQAARAARTIIERLDGNPDAEAETTAVALALLGQAEIGEGNARSGIQHLENSLSRIEELSLDHALPQGRSSFYFRNRQVRSVLTKAYYDAGNMQAAWHAAERASDFLIRTLDSRARIDADPASWRKHVAHRERARYRESECLVLAPTLRRKCQQEVAQAQEAATRTLEVFHGNAARRRGAARLSSSDIRANLSPNEAILSVHSAGTKWRSFFVTESEVLGNLADDPMIPWLSRLAKLKHLYVVSEDSEVAFGLPLVEVAGEAIAQRLLVSYVPTSAFVVGRVSTRTNETTTFIVPSLDLPKTLLATRFLAETTPASHLLQGSQALRAPIFAALAQADNLHFAGHGSIDANSPESWSNRLRIAGGAYLDVNDVLTARLQLSTVILSGCSTGPLASQHSVGLAEAWLIAGSGSVLATTRPIRDGASTQLIADLYNFGWPKTPGPAWQRAVQAAVMRGDDAWKNYRFHGRP